MRKSLMCLMVLVGCGGDPGSSTFDIDYTKPDPVSVVPDADTVDSGVDAPINGSPCPGPYGECPGQLGRNNPFNSGNGPPGNYHPLQ